MKTKAEKGEWISKIPFGYKDKNFGKYDKRTGKKIPCDLVIVEDKSHIVRLVYSLLQLRTPEKEILIQTGITRGNLQGIVNNINRKSYHGFVFFKDLIGKEYFFKGKHQPILYD